MAKIEAHVVVKTAMPWQESQGIGFGDMKIIKVEGRGIRKRRSWFATELSPRNGKRGILKIFHGNGTNLISPRNGKEIYNKEND
jgi:hypothetical protein